MQDLLFFIQNFKDEYIQFYLTQKDLLSSFGYIVSITTLQG